MKKKRKSASKEKMTKSANDYIGKTLAKLPPDTFDSEDKARAALAKLGIKLVDDICEVPTEMWEHVNAVGYLGVAKSFYDHEKRKQN